MAYGGQPQVLNTTAFGDLAIAEVTGQIQLEFPVNVSPEIVNTTAASTGTVTSSPPFIVLSTGSSATGSSSFQSIDRLHYKNGEGSLILFTTIFNTGVANSQQYVGFGDNSNGFFFGWNGSTFGILYRSSIYGASVSSISTVDTWIYQASWNGDPFDGTGGSGVTLNPTLGNVYKIQMQWLGFGNVSFFIESAATGQFVLVHQLQYPNTYVNTSLSNPNLPLSAIIKNTGNTSNLIMKVPSMGAFTEGIIYSNNIRYSASGTNSGFINDNLVLSIQNVYTFNGIINQKAVLLDFTSLWSDSNANPVMYRFTLNPVLSTFSYISVSTGTSVVQYYSPGSQSVTLTRQSNTRSLVFLMEGTTGQVNLSLNPLGIILNPGDILTVSTSSLTTFSGAYCSLSWVEQF